MTAEIITFSVAKRPPPEYPPQSSSERLSDILATGFYWLDQGMGPQDLPANIDPRTRELFDVILSINESHRRGDDGPAA